MTLLWEAYQGEQEVALVGKVKVPIQGRRLDFANNLSRLEVAEFITANCACTAKALQKVGGFDERFTLAWREDSDLHFKILSSGIPIKQTQALVVHPVRKAPWWISLKEQRKVFFNILLKKKFPALYFQRIQASPLLLYYSTVFSFLLVLVSLVSRENSMAKFFFLLWVSLVFLLVIKRLRNASLHLDNVLQVTLTSLLIPFLSTYWRLLGLFKFRRIAAAE